ncbi:COX15/CtaA family protein [Deinococcus roseus]|uniref:Heme A synthase n=1 Tax=Deinococcus roseus TaxID=392414 RepID=A0ABQ2CU09_9DEIO|nr:COX15/CtaA family protein [Deinococcus roseus]GGJ20624.1 hypothetical protein GCM10008938_03620 [Deinococcus roseus]
MQHGIKTLTLGPVKLDFTTFAWLLFAYNVLVILWGAWVRITGSGAGCGDHWPDCNGTIFPRTHQVESLIEFTHRATSALSGFGAIGLVVWSRLAYPKKHPARTLAGWHLGFVILEGLVGALLVKKEWVGQDESFGRALFMPIHMANTLLLTGTAALTALRSQPRPAVLKPLLWVRISLWVAVVGTILMGMSGAVAALGNTLNPVDSLQEGLSRALTPRYYLDQLKLLHPSLTVITSVLLVAWARVMASRFQVNPVQNAAAMLQTAILLQVIAGIFNYLLHAPGWLQVLHLLLACLLWLAVILLGYHGWVQREKETP